MRIWTDLFNNQNFDYEHTYCIHLYINSYVL